VVVTAAGEGRFEARVGTAAPLAVRLVGDGPGELRCELDGVETTAWVARDGDAALVQLGGVEARFELAPVARAKSRAGHGDGRVNAPITGQVLTVSVAAGDTVEAGALLVTLTAMKMEHRVLAPSAGRVGRLAVGAGDQVAARQLLVELHPTGGDA
jgi:acetyl/propionyl-CoA carboxylase alpha subunit